MNTYMRGARSVALFCWLLCGMLLPTSAQAAAPSAPPQIDAVKLLDMVRMNKGKVVVLNFFATWCPPCREEIPGLIALSKAYPTDKVAFIGISVDQEAAKLAPFVQRMEISYPVFLAGEDIPPLFGVRTIPHNAVYDPQGKLAANQPGFVSEEDLKEFIDILLEQKTK